jgi:DNA (cytosine-5)-methyltransferase 3A
MNILSLFDGMSCGQLALNRANVHYDKYYASEIEKNSIKVTQHNFPNTIQLGDVSKVNGKDLDKIDLIMGGSPCQSFSFAGKMKGMATKDEKEILSLESYLSLKEAGFEFEGESYLFWEYVRLLKETNPTYFLLENVMMKDYWKKVISDTLGVEPIMINSNLVSAQDRKRLYWTNIPNVGQPDDLGLHLRDIMEESVADKYNITERFYKKKEGTLSYSKSRGNIRPPERKSKTLTTSGHGISNSESTNIKLSDDYLRIPTPLECERLQTVPDNYTNVGLLDSHRYKMLGNGWTVSVISHIFKNIHNKND